MSLLIRADGNSQIGTGHIMRCLALAQAWQAECQNDIRMSPVFVMADKAAGLVARLSVENIPVNYLQTRASSQDDAAQTIDQARQIGAKWVVVDGYHFDAAYQQAIKTAGLQLLVIDDYGHAAHYYADIVLNQNIYANESFYPNREAYTRLLLGPQYVLLRREFWPWRGWQREIPPVAYKVLVTLGGSDPDDVTLKVIQALQQVEVEGLEARVVVGPANPHLVTLQQAVEQLPKVQLLTEVLNMPELMAWADVAISAGGSTCWELAFMGVPSLVMILADNQQRVAEGLDAAGFAFNLGDPVNLCPTALANAFQELAHQVKPRTASAKCGQELVDGFGRARVIQQMQAFNLTFRFIQAEDCHLIWQWANEPTTRANSFSTEPISWESHQVWFNARLADPQCLFYLALANNKPVGQIRYQIEGEEAVVSVGLDPKQRGQGYGSWVIRLVSHQVLANRQLQLIHAYIKPDNATSLGAFSKAGFFIQDTTEIQGNKAIHMVLQKEAQL
ncbi:MAG: UDP-2,4-diacetamido-2,4,6-trideoxy-beta-L-altropyranose hydrolase [Anaerolineae bacterium]